MVIKIKPVPDQTVVILTGTAIGVPCGFYPITKQAILGKLPFASGMQVGRTSSVPGTASSTDLTTIENLLLVEDEGQVFVLVGYGGELIVELGAVPPANGFTVELG